MKRTRRHSLGQHFLANGSVLQKIVRVIAPAKTDVIIEIGAGKGALTFALAEEAGHVTAIEKDPSLLPFLREKEGPRLTVLEADVLDADFREVLKRAGARPGETKLVGNLPYSISSPILFKALESKALFARCVFLIQKEVAERVCARPRSKDYAPLSILVQNAFEARLEFKVSPGSFSPPPRVDSAVISLTKRAQPLYPVADEVGFRALLWAAFAHRRKFLVKNLEMSGIARARVEEAYRLLGLAGNARAEELSIGQFAALFRTLG
jgi:16S rRNA (adenine1518-N6/adenine1519-N6)-dimethyltransferase